MDPPKWRGESTCIWQGYIGHQIETQELNKSALDWDTPNLHLTCHKKIHIPTMLQNKQEWEILSFAIFPTTPKLSPNELHDNCIRKKTKQHLLVGTPNHHAFTQELHRIGCICIQIIQRTDRIPSTVPIKELLSSPGTRLFHSSQPTDLQ